MNEIREEIVDGIMAGARDAAANLFKVANSGDHGRMERARAGIEDITNTAVMMLTLVKEVFDEDANG